MEKITQGKASSEQQRMYDIVMLQVRGMVFNDGGIQTTLEQIKGAEKGPARGIGYTAAMLIKSVQGGLKEKGKKIPPEILMGAYAETVADLTEIAVAAGIVPEEAKAEVAKAAMADGAQIFRASGQKKPAQPAGQPGIIKQASGA
jgi:hypothetical protein